MGPMPRSMWSGAISFGQLGGATTLNKAMEIRAHGGTVTLGN